MGGCPGGSSESIIGGAVPSGTELAIGGIDGVEEFDSFDTR